MELTEYTKKELVAMLSATFAPMEFYANLEVSFVAGGKPFARPDERRAFMAMKIIRTIQKEALERQNEANVASRARASASRNNNTTNPTPKKSRASRVRT